MSNEEFEVLVDEMIGVLAPQVYDVLETDDEDVILPFDAVASTYIYEKNIKEADTLRAIAKAGTYIRYASSDIIHAHKAEIPAHDIDIVKLVMDLKARKIEEDTVHEEDEAEVERLIEETDEILDEAEQEAEDSDEEEEVEEESESEEETESED